MPLKKRIRCTLIVAASLSLAAGPIFPGAPGKAKTQTPLHVQYEELTSLEFLKAVPRSAGVCLIPIGILEKHGPHLPLGTDLLDVREVALRAAGKEYCVVYPPYYFGQIHEGKHQPGTIAYSADLIWKALQETCDELARNGMKKIVLVNGHGGNNHFLHYFCQTQLAGRKGYSIVLFSPSSNPDLEAKIKALQKTTLGGHADEQETSTLLAHRPDLVHLDQAAAQSGADQKRLAHLRDAYTGIWWYAQYPNHYAGNGSPAAPELGKLLLETEAGQLVELIRALKKDTAIQALQERFYREAENPLETKQ